MTAVPDLLERVRRDAERLALPRLLPGAAPVVTAGELAGLPPVVRRYLDFMGVTGRPRDRSFRARFTGRFRLGPDRRWMRCDAWQYDLAWPVTRLFHMRLSAGPVPLIGHDVYAAGRGQMRGRLFGLVPVVDGSGPEFDVGELTTYLNDCILIAPSMLLGPATTWTVVDGSSFDVTFTDSGISVAARVFVDSTGAPVDFRTTDRWAALDGGMVRVPWSTPVDDWTTVRGRPVPRHGRAMWHLEDGDFEYIEGELDPETVEWDVPAGPPRCPAARSRRWPVASPPWQG